jgi:alpha-N-arabinofuranosidase
MESLINGHWEVMGEYDPQRRVKLIVDEWGAWHARAADMPPTYLWAYPGTLRDALVSGITLDTFNRHADKVAMANVAQLVNTIHSLFLAYEDRFVATPNFHVFEMYAAHQGGQAVRALFSAPKVTYTVDGKPATLWGLQGSASLHDKQLVLTVVNPHHAEAREAEIAVRGASVRSGQSRTLTSADVHAHNTFAQPNALVPADAPLAASGPVITYRFPPASVTRLLLTLA